MPMLSFSVYNYYQPHKKSFLQIEVQTSETSCSVKCRCLITTVTRPRHCTIHEQVARSTKCLCSCNQIQVISAILIFGQYRLIFYLPCSIFKIIRGSQNICTPRLMANSTRNALDLALALALLNENIFEFRNVINAAHTHCSCTYFCHDHWQIFFRFPCLIF